MPRVTVIGRNGEARDFEAREGMSLMENRLTTRDFGRDNAQLSAFNLAMGDRIQPQDVAAIEAIETMLQSLPAPPAEMSCRADTGALKVRHRLARQIAAEQPRMT